MFDGHALLLLLLLLVLAGIGWHSHLVARRRLEKDIAFARALAHAVPRPRPIHVVCGTCGTRLCDTTSLQDACLVAEAHHLFAHAGAA